MTDFYLPNNPKFILSQESIDSKLYQQQQEYDRRRFKDLTASKEKLEKENKLRIEQRLEEVEAMKEYCNKLGEIQRKYKDLRKKL